MTNVRGTETRQNASIPAEVSLAARHRDTVTVMEPWSQKLGPTGRGITPVQHAPLRALRVEAAPPGPVAERAATGSHMAPVAVAGSRPARGPGSMGAVSRSLPLPVSAPCRREEQPATGIRKGSTTDKHGRHQSAGGIPADSDRGTQPSSRDSTSRACQRARHRTAGRSSVPSGRRDPKRRRSRRDTDCTPASNGSRKASDRIRSPTRPAAQPISSRPPPRAHRLDRHRLTKSAGFNDCARDNDNSGQSSSQKRHSVGVWVSCAVCCGLRTRTRSGRDRGAHGGGTDSDCRSRRDFPGSTRSRELLEQRCARGRCRSPRSARPLVSVSGTSTRDRRSTA